MHHNGRSIVTHTWTYIRQLNSVHIINPFDTDDIVTKLLQVFNHLNFFNNNNNSNINNINNNNNINNIAIDK